MWVWALALSPAALAQTDRWPADLATAWAAQPYDSLRWEVFFAYLDTSSLDPARQADLISQALEPIHQSGMRRMEGRALQKLGVINLEQADYQRASRNLVHALQVFETLGDSALIAGVLTNLGSLNFHMQQFPPAIAYWKSAAGYYERHPNPLRLAINYSNLGAAYSEMNMLDSARWFHRHGLEKAREAGDAAQIASAYNNLGVTAEYSGRLDEALGHYQNAQKILDSLQDIQGLVRSYLNISYILESNRRLREAYDMNLKALELLPRSANPSLYRLAYLNLANVTYKLGSYKEAYEYLQKYQVYKDSFLNEQTARTVQELQTQYETEKKEREIAELNLLAETQQGRLRDKDLLLAGMLALALLLGGLVWTILRTKRRSDELLLNILPAALTRELKSTGRVKPRRHEAVSVLFADLVGFTLQGRDLPPETMIALVDRYYQAFDHIIEKHGVEKIKTIGDAYMCAAGVPEPHPHHAVALIDAGLEMLEWVERQRGVGSEARVWQVRIGIHSGPVVSGVAGKRRYAFDIWGTTVNIAARMEQYGLPGRINISEATARHTAGKFFLEARPPVEVKGLGAVTMYLVKSRRELPVP